MDCSEVYLEVFVGEELFVGHLDGDPGPVEPASEVDCLGGAVGEGNGDGALLADLFLHRPFVQVAWVGSQLDSGLEDGVVSEAEGFLRVGGNRGWRVSPGIEQLKGLCFAVLGGDCDVEGEVGLERVFELNFADEVVGVGLVVLVGHCKLLQFVDVVAVLNR